MTDYKNTLNLPKTKFAMKANLPQREPEMLAKWQQLDIYRQLRQDRASADKFILHDGPIYANGDIHMGHVTNKVLKDIVIKSQALSGKDVPFVPGWDCHGLPIELQVEKKIGKAGIKTDHKRFRRKCREFAAKQLNRQRQDFKRLGLLGDWDNPYQTMDYSYEANTIRALAGIVAQGHLQQGSKPVYWCTDCASSLAEAEVEYQNKSSHSIYIRFPVANPEKWQRAFAISDINTRLSALAWTTTPWTLPASMALTVGPDIEYALVAIDQGGGQEHIVLATELIASVLAASGVENHRVIATCQGQKLEHLQLQHPFYQDRLEPVLLGTHVSTESGTGVVHTAPAHGHDDFVVCQHYGIEVYNPVDARGCFIDSVPVVGGNYYQQANELVLAELQRQHNLWQADMIEHSYPHCWRHKSPLIFRATSQWFISMSKHDLRTQAQGEVQNVQWLPAWGRERMYKMLADRPDWCISRQRSWGVPIPLFVHKQTGEPHPDTVAIMRQVADIVDEHGIESWYDLKAETILGAQAEAYEQVTDILDVWFDSGASHFCVLTKRPELHAPADLYLEGSDQHRGWFQTSLLTSVGLNGSAPYKQVLTHGFVVDGSGRKMSKSLGNVVSPKEVIKTWGGDIVRLWVASSDFRYEINFSDEIIKRTADSYRRIRNTARFLLSNLDGFEPSQQVAWSDMVALDQWVVIQACAVEQAVIAAYHNYKFSAAVEAISLFCVNDLGGFYLDVIKDRQYTCQADSSVRRSAQTAMFHLIHILARLLAPVLSFTADEIWQHIPGAKDHDSVLLSQWYQLPVKDGDGRLSQADWQLLIKVREQVNQALEPMRAAKQLGASLQAEVVLYVDAGLHQVLAKLGRELHFIFIVSQAQLADLDQSPPEALTTDMPGLRLLISPSKQAKCERCWHYTATVGANAEHPDICARCVSNTSGAGESRVYV